MTEPRSVCARVRRWLFGSPLALTPPDREDLAHLRALMRENEDQVERVPLSLRDFPNAVSLRYPEGLYHEAEFRRWARRSGEHVRA